MPVLFLDDQTGFVSRWARRYDPDTFSSVKPKEFKAVFTTYRALVQGEEGKGNALSAEARAALDGEMKSAARAGKTVADVLAAWQNREAQERGGKAAELSGS